MLAPAVAPDGAPQLAGYGLDDGVRRWAVPLPAAVHTVRAEGGHLLVRTAGTLVAMG